MAQVVLVHVTGATVRSVAGPADGEPKVVRSAGPCRTGVSTGQMIAAWAPPIRRSARSAGERVNVSLTTAANASAATGTMIIPITRTERPLARRASRRATRSATRHPWSHLCAETR